MNRTGIELKLKIKNTEKIATQDLKDLAKIEGLLLDLYVESHPVDPPEGIKRVKPDYKQFKEKYMELWLAVQDIIPKYKFLSNYAIKHKIDEIKDKEVK